MGSNHGTSSEEAPDTTPRPARRVLVFDTTMRDGEQAPGFQMDVDEKLRLGRALEALGVDAIEAGFPAASEGDFEAVRAVSREVREPIVAGLSRCTRGDVARTWEALRDAARPRIHLFLGTSSTHREFKLGMDTEDVLRATREAIASARELCEDVEFSPEDASRTEPDFLAEVVETAIEAGATTMNVPDTVGFATPEEYGAVFERLRRQVRDIENIVLSAHCHDDLGLAVANTLAAVRAGAGQVECTINGIGERAGNCALEEVVMALRTRRDAFGIETGVDTRRLVPTSHLLAAITGVETQPNKAIVGRNAFAHEAGIHQHGVLRNAATYEIMRPEDVGVRSQLVLGKHSGRHALRARLAALGYELDEGALDAAFTGFKTLCDRKKTIYDADLEALIGGQRDGAHAWRIERLHVNAGTDVLRSASVRLAHERGEVREEAAVGDGPIDAAFKAIARAAGVEGTLRDYHVRSVTLGEDAQGSVTVAFEHGGRQLRGHGVSTDIVEASARAFVDAINRIAPDTPGHPEREEAPDEAAYALR